MMKDLRTYLFSLLFFLTILWCTGIIAAPILRHSMQKENAGMLYSFYSHVCHQDAARSFEIGGEKYGVCMRCTSIYFGFLAGMLIFLFSHRLGRTDTPRRRYLFVFFFPMITDVILNNTGLILSTTISRILTGVLFGGILPWWIVPLFIEGCIQILRKKKNQSQDTGVYDYAAET